MLSRLHKSSLFSLALWLGLLAGPALAQQQPAAPATPPARRPLYIFNLASVSRALTNTGKMFEAAGRPDMIEVIAEYMASSLGDIGGIDRELPIGQMAFLDSTVLPPQPRFVSYIPVTDFAAFFQTMELSGGRAVQKSDTEFEIQYPNFTIPVRLQNGYLFMPPPSQELPTFDLPDPRELTADLTRRYDVAMSLPITNVPEGIRNLFATVLKSQGSANLQQHDNESDAAFEARRLQGDALLELLTLILTDGKEVTLGLDVTEDGRRAAVELTVIANAKSQFSGYLGRITGKQSSFNPLMNSNDPLRLSMSWNAGKYEKQLLQGSIDSLRNYLTNLLPESSTGAIEGLGKSLSATVEQGHLDGLMKIVPNDDGQMMLYGGVKIVGGQTFDRSLREVLMQTGMVAGPRFKIDLDTHRHNEVSLHRITRDGGFGGGSERRTYGEGATFYLGAGGSTLWFGYGQDSVVNALDQAVDSMTSSTSVRAATTNAPLQGVFRLKPWLNLPTGNGQRAQFQRDLAVQATKDGNDELNLEMQPLDDGMRVKIQIQDAFVKLLGLGLATWYDQSQM